MCNPAGSNVIVLIQSCCSTSRVKNPLEKRILADLLLTKLPSIIVNSLYQCVFATARENLWKYRAYLDKQILITPGWGKRAKSPRANTPLWSRPRTPSSLHFHGLNNKVYFVPWSILQPDIFSACCTILFFVHPGQFGPKDKLSNDQQGDHVSLCINRFDTMWVNILAFKEFKSLRGRGPGFIQNNLPLRTPVLGWKGQKAQ